MTSQLKKKIRNNKYSQKERGKQVKFQGERDHHKLWSATKTKIMKSEERRKEETLQRFERKIITGVK